MSTEPSTPVAELNIRLRVDSLEQLARVLEALRGAPQVTAVSAPAEAVETAESAEAAEAPAPARRGRRPRAAAAEAKPRRRRGRRAIVPPAGGTADVNELLRKAPPLQQRLVQFLAENAGRRFTTAELLDPMGVQKPKQLGGRLTGFKKTLGEEGVKIVRQHWLGKEFEYWVEQADAARVLDHFAQHPVSA